MTTIGVAGAGTMGVGIAAVLAAAGHRVLLYEPSSAVRWDVPARLSAMIEEIGTAGDVEIVAELGALAPANIVIEAAPEDVEIKHALYAELFASLGEDAMVASNTSSIMPDRLAALLSDAEASRFLVAHFWNPPHLLPLVELVPGTRTASTAVSSFGDLLLRAGFRPVTLERAVPGFIGNRLQLAVLREALSLIESGVATPEAIDEVVRFSIGRRYAITGPIESADLGGLHVFLAIAAQILPDLAARDEGTSTLAALVASGRTGLRAGAGFYDWTEARTEAVARRRRFMLAHRAALE